MEREGETYETYTPLFIVEAPCKTIMYPAMARNIPKQFFFFFFITIFFVSNIVVVDGKPPTHFSRTLNPTEMGFKREKLTHLHFYFHDIVSGPNATAIRVAATPTTNVKSNTVFGAVVVMDNALTKGPNSTSKIIGRAQGIYVSASQSEIGFLMALNFAFMEGKYNGSTLSILGRNAIFSEVREMPVVGGSGVFRFARGYAEAKTTMFNLTSQDAIVEYNVFVFHY